VAGQAILGLSDGSKLVFISLKLVTGKLKALCNSL
jgi:hypothetical protein